MKIALVTAFPPSRQALNEYGFHIAEELRQQPGIELTILGDTLSEPAPELVAGIAVEDNECAHLPLRYRLRQCLDRREVRRRSVCHRIDVIVADLLPRAQRPLLPEERQRVVVADSAQCHRAADFV